MVPALQVGFEWKVAVLRIDGGRRIRAVELGAPSTTQLAAVAPDLKDVAAIPAGSSLPYGFGKAIKDGIARRRRDYFWKIA